MQWIINLISILIFYYFCVVVLTKKIYHKIQLQHVIIVVFFILKVFISNLYSPRLNLLAALILHISVLSLFESKLSKKIIILILYMTFSVLSEEIGMQIMESFYGSFVKLSGLEHVLFGVICQFILILLLLVATLILNNIQQNSINWKNIISILAYPTATIYFIIIQRYPIFFKNVNIGNFTAILLFIFANIITCLLFYKIQLEEKNKHENEILKQNQERDQAYFNLLIKKNEKEKALLHDVDKHEHYILELLHDERYQDAIAYQETILGKRKEQRIFITNNKTLDIILNMFKDKIIDNHINLDITDVEPVSFHKVSEIDQCTIFSNLIENAINASILVSNRYIKISLHSLEYNRIAFKISNNYDPAIVKKNDELHGYGLKNVKECIKKYFGIISFKQCENEYIVIVILKDN